MAKSRGTRWWLSVAVTLLAVAKTRAREDEGKEKEGTVRCHDAIPKVGALTCSVGTAFRLAGLLKVRIALAEKKNRRELRKIETFDETYGGEDQENAAKKDKGWKNPQEDGKDDSCYKYSIQTDARDDERGGDNYEFGKRGTGDAKSELGDVADEFLARRNKREASRDNGE